MLILMLVSITQVVVSLGQFWIELDGFPIAWRWPPRTAPVPSGIPHVVIRARIVRFECERLAIAGQRFFISPLLFQHHSHVAVDAGVFRIQADGLPIAGKRFLMPSQVVQHAPPSYCRLQRSSGSVRSPAHSVPPLARIAHERYRCCPRLLWASA